MREGNEAAVSQSGVGAQLSPPAWQCPPPEQGAGEPGRWSPRDSLSQEVMTSLLHAMRCAAARNDLKVYVIPINEDADK